MGTCRYAAYASSNPKCADIVCIMVPDKASVTLFPSTGVLLRNPPALHSNFYMSVFMLIVFFPPFLVDPPSALSIAAPGDVRSWKFIETL